MTTLSKIAVQSIIDFLCAAYPNIISIYLFGSFATKNANTSSDIDLAIYPPSKLEGVELWKKSQALANLLHHEVDLIDFNAAPTVLQFQIIHHGKRLFCRDTLQANLFENAIDSLYLELQERRKTLIEDIIQRGKIYD